MDEVTLKYEEEKAKWLEAETAEDKHTVLKEGFDIAKELNRMIVEAHQDLKAALIEIKQAAVSAANDNETEVEEEEIEDETEDDSDTEGDSNSDANASE